MKKLLFQPILFVFLFQFSVCFAQEEKGSHRLESIIVTATRIETPVELSPANVHVLTREEIEIKAPSTVDEVLNELPGVYVRRGKGLMDTLSSITLRGIPDQKRTLILMDGIPLNNSYTGNVRLGGYYPEDLERVEVVKGPFSALYGGYAMGGVVNFITKMPEKREFTLKAGYGSAWKNDEGMEDLRRVYLSYGDKMFGKLSVFLSYGWQGTHGYPTDLNVQTTRPPANITGYEVTRTREGRTAYIIGHRGDNEWWDDGITIKAQYELQKDKKINLSFMRNRYRYDYEDPDTYLRNASGNPVWSYSGVRENTFLPGGGGAVQNQYSVGFETPVIGNLKMKVNISFLESPDSWYVTTSSQATRAGCGQDPKQCGYVSNTPSDAYMGDLQFTLPLFKNHTFTFGGALRLGHANTKEHYLKDWRDEDSKAGLKYESEGKDRTYSFFIQDEIAFKENLIFYLGFRQDFWKTYDGYANDVGKTGYPKVYPSKTASSFSPKFAFVYKQSESRTFRGSIGRAFRPPTVYELYRTWTSTAGVTYAGNPHLDPEYTLSWDIGLEQKLPWGTKISLTYFENHMKDLIYRKTVTSTLQEYVNVGKAESRGIEVQADQKLGKWIKIYGSLTYTDSEIKKNPVNPSSVGCRLTYTPHLTANLGMDFEKSRWSLKLYGRYVDKVYATDDNRDRVSNVYGSYDSYLLVDGRVSYDVTKYAKLSFSVDNIFNKKYYYYYKAPGRSWFTELTLKF
ncbi:MAG: TonB-dependent receptor [Deltaproteobacteria bacterium]|nr:TonB-dependent receptor [Deltaproteobacteria bacterium]